MSVISQAERLKKWAIFVILSTLISTTMGCFSSKTPSRQISIEQAPGIHKTSRKKSAIDHVVVISVDGLGALYLKPMLAKRQLPGFKRLQEQGAWTHDARADHFITVTLPNHLTMITGLPTSPTPGGPSTAYHGYTANGMPLPNATLHNSGNPNRPYIPSMFDVAHDFGLKTCLFAGKAKFVLIDRSYDEAHGAKDNIGEDNGADKIDRTFISDDMGALTERFISELNTEIPCNLTLFHLADPDTAGHRYGWGSEPWQQRVAAADSHIRTIMDTIIAHPAMGGKSALIVTADHGGHGFNHGNARLEANFTIPFYLWAPGIPAGVDLYEAFSASRVRFRGSNPGYETPKHPIRNGDAANLALDLLGLPSIPDSVIFGMKQ